jgi:hypothetical protein
MLAVKDPDPKLPLSVVLSLAIVGDCDVLQQTPLAVIVAPPSFVILPPEVVVVVVVFVSAVVESVGNMPLAAPPIIFVHVVPLYT